jgi:glycosyltransferase involved in cell wall biosynthesis
MSPEYQSPGRVLVAIPAYNEALTLGSVLQQLRSAQPDIDVVVVNDGSRDRTEAVATEQGVILLNHFYNLGYGRAIQTAIRFAERNGYDVLVTYDADGQHRPEDVQALLGAFGAAGYDVLIGSRFMPGAPGYRAPWSRRMGMRLFSLVVRTATGTRIHDTSSGLRVIRRSYSLHLRAGCLSTFTLRRLSIFWDAGIRSGSIRLPWKRDAMVHPCTACPAS